jgi:hypothetical protein
VVAVEVTQKLSLCPECGACPEVEVLRLDDSNLAVLIGEGEEKVALSRGAWNNLVRYVREGVLGEL